jgi:hypothetical protein
MDIPFSPEKIINNFGYIASTKPMKTNGSYSASIFCVNPRQLRTRYSHRSRPKPIEITHCEAALDLSLDANQILL